MHLFVSIALPALLALAGCIHLGYAWARLLLPEALADARAPLTPILGVAIFICIVALGTTTTPLTPPQIAAGLCVAALPLNIWAWRRRPRVAWHGGASFPALLAGAWAWLAGTMPLWWWGASLPIGSNWDASEFYVPLGRALQLVSQRDIPTLPANPLVSILATPPVSGRIHAFSYLHAAVSTASAADPLSTFAPLMALVAALTPLAVYALALGAGLRRGAAFAAVLAGVAYLPIWVGYNNFSNHVISLPLVPAAVGASIVAVRDGGRRAILTGGLLVAGVAIGYYPALTAYAAQFGGAALVLLAAQRSAAPLRRIASLAAVSLAASLPAQWYFFFREGFLGEVARQATGFQIDEYVPLPDFLGLQALFRGESIYTDQATLRLALAGAALLLAAGLLHRRATLITAVAAGAGLYQLLTALQQYHYGFYKGATFALPPLACLLASGAAFLWASTARRPQLVVQRTLAVLVVALLSGTAIATTWRVAERYTAARPQLWSIEQAQVRDLAAHVPAAASVLVVPPDGAPPTFNSLLSYTLLGHQLYGSYAIGYNALGNPPDNAAPTMALLPDGADPSAYGYRAADLRWAGAGVQLYGRAADVLLHQSFGASGRAPLLAPGASIRLHLATDGVVFDGEKQPVGRGTVAPVITVAAFAPSTMTLQAGAQMQTFALAAGATELPLPLLPVPAELLLTNTGPEPVALWWAELRTIAPTQPVPRDDAFLSVDATADGRASLRLHTQPLPTGTQKLTGLVTVGRNVPGAPWEELGRWVFFPQTGTYELIADPATLTLRGTAGGQLLELAGSARTGGDGEYTMSLLLANDTQIIYATTLWTWQVSGGIAGGVSSDSTAMAALPLPSAAQPIGRAASDGTLLLRGLTLPDTTARPNGTLRPVLLWQSLAPTPTDLQAQVRVVAGGQVLAEFTAPLGKPEYGTSRWQTGELSEQHITLTLPETLPAAPITLDVTLLTASGDVLPFTGTIGPLPLIALRP